MDNELKLNYRRTMYIGFAFFSILMVWQIYNHYGSYYLDVLLENRIEVRTERAYIVGIIMALDNFFALFMLPIFGILSDKTKTRYGRRIPYIIVGMFASAIIFPFIAVFYVYNSLAGVIAVMLIILIIMNIYRNPAISLMPDVTPKPLRSRANGIINLIGYVGAIIAGGLALAFGQSDTVLLINLIPFLIASGVMLIAMVVLFIKIKENAIVEETKDDMLLGEAMSQTISKVGEDVPLSKPDKRNMIIILISVFLWFAAFNAIETFISIYSDEVFDDMRWGGLVVIALVLSSMITFVPAGFLAAKIGRKKSVLLGLVTLLTGLIICLLINALTVVFFFGIFLSGVGWALINVNSYPMVVEMSHRNNVGRYTGYYYTSSMLAQSFTPIIAGFVILIGESYEVLFPYAAVLALLALIAFTFIKEKRDIKRDIKHGIDAFDVE